VGVQASSEKGNAAVSGGGGRKTKSLNETQKTIRKVQVDAKKNTGPGLSKTDETNKRKTPKKD